MGLLQSGPVVAALRVESAIYGYSSGVYTIGCTTDPASAGHRPGAALVRSCAQTL